MGVFEGLDEIRLPIRFLTRLILRITCYKHCLLFRICNLMGIPHVARTAMTPCVSNGSKSALYLQVRILLHPISLHVQKTAFRQLRRIAHRASRR